MDRVSEDKILEISEDLVARCFLSLDPAPPDLRRYYGSSILWSLALLAENSIRQSNPHYERLFSEKAALGLKTLFFQSASLIFSPLWHETYPNDAEAINNPKAVGEFLRGHSGLIYLLALRFHGWQMYAERLIQRWQNDEEKVCADFFSNVHQGIFTHIKCDSSHGICRSVAIIAFANGNRIVYKPRPLDIEEQFQHFCSYLNSKGLSPSLAHYKVLSKEGYGWMEFINHEACSSSEQIARLAQKCGMLLGICYLLNGSNIHNRNVIFRGEDPHLIDLESLFSDYNPHNSIYSTGLISPPSSEEHLLAMPGFGIDSFQSPIELQEFSQKNSNFPFLGNLAISLTDYPDEFIGGFRRLYELVLNNQEELLQYDGPLKTFENCFCRFKMRLSGLYYYILTLISKKTLLKNVSVLFHGLAEMLSYAPKEIPVEIPSEILLKERMYLADGDFPIFYTKPYETSLYDDNGLFLKKFYPSEPTINLVYERIKTFNHHHLAVQEALLRAALQPERPTPPHEIPAPIPQHHTTDKELLRVIHELASHIDLLVFGENALPTPSHLTPLKYLLGNIYSGSGGIGIFYSGLYKLTQEPKWRERALACAQHTHTTYMQQYCSAPSHTIGLFSGLGSGIYALSTTGKLLGDTEVMAHAALLARKLDQSFLQRCDNTTICNGLAGYLLALLSLPPETTNDSLLSCCAEQLLMSAFHNPPPNPCLIFHKMPGFFHGNGGIAYAIAHYSQREGILPAYQGSKRSLEASIANRVYQQDQISKTSAGSWSHGLAGLLIAYSALKEKCSSETLLPYLAKLSNGNLLNLDQIYHGNFGHLEACFALSKESQEAQEAYQKLLDSLIQQYAVRKHFCLFNRLPDGLNGGFLNGLAGIGYTLLRILGEKQGIALPNVLIGE